MNKLLVAAAAAVLGFPATIAQAASPTAEAAQRYEIAYLGLSAVDAAETITCLHKDICTEGNPLLGKHPSAFKLIAGKVLVGSLHYAVFRYILARNPHTALRVAQISAGVQGGVVLLNARIFF